MKVALGIGRKVRRRNSAWIWANGVKLKMILIPAGEFMMGNAESAEDSAAFFRTTYGEDFLTGRFL